MLTYVVTGCPVHICFHRTIFPADSSPLDVLVTNCSAHDGRPARSQQLIDEDGCTIDPAIMSPVIEYPRHGAGERL